MEDINNIIYFVVVPGLYLALLIGMKLSKSLGLNLNQKLSKRSKRLFVLFLLATEMAVIGSYAWMTSKPIGKYGFLIKNGDSYLLVWQADEQEFRSQPYPTLRSALSFAREELELHVGPRPAFPDSVEHTWMRSEVGKTVVLWKTLNVSFLNQLTFRREADARFFHDAFRSGAYSTSPLGHAIALVPIRHSVQ